MAEFLFFENIHTKKRYKILSFDRDAGTVKLIGAHNSPFEMEYSKELFQQMGYTLVKGEQVPA